MLSARDRVCIERKAGDSIQHRNVERRLRDWRYALKTFRQRLVQARFKGIVFDYDGTLIDTRYRKEALSEDIATELSRLLDGGLSIGIATGRGRSVRQDLQAAIPRRHWNSVLIGYYNGADCGFVKDSSHPDRTEHCADELREAASIIESNVEIRASAQITYRRFQITIEPTSADLDGERLWHLVNEVLQPISQVGIRIVRSSHSVDILAPGISKEGLVTRLATHSGCKVAQILCIGDRGRWPGNDFELLKHPFSLSVDESSYDESTCWNLAPAGQRGVQATLTYMRCIKLHRGTARMILKHDEKP